jgi:membrane protein implicated in regulation of membrane protease activity
MTTTDGDERADRIAARATGFGTGLIVFMLTWTIGARITVRLLDAPDSAYTAMAIAILIGAVSTLWVGHRLVESLATSGPELQQMEGAAPVR